MKLYAKLKDETTREFEVINQLKAKELGWSVYEVEMGYDGLFYESSYAHAVPPKN